ncbi:MAG: hypothetical protein IAF38_12015 [Bacteroidia bacterium]|nr:hypothetical protein [Bacteroidia bacterium]
MKKSMITFTVAALIAGTFFTSCNTPAEKVENEQNNVIEAKEDLAKANQELLDDMDSYRKEKTEIIAANEKSIADFKERIEKEKKSARAEYEEKIVVLEQKNSDMKRKMDDYKADGKEGWEQFKTEFSRDMSDLSVAVANFMLPNPKK